MNNRVWSIPAIELFNELARRKVDLIKVETTLDPALSVIEIRKDEMRQRIKAKDDEAWDFFNAFEECYDKIDWSEVRKTTFEYIDSCLRELIKKELEEDKYLPF